METGYYLFIRSLDAKGMADRLNDQREYLGQYLIRSEVLCLIR